jgi:DNA repair protein RadC
MKEAQDKVFKEYLMSGQLASMVCEAVRGEAVSEPLAVYRILKPIMAQNRDREQFWMIALDNKNRTIAIERLFIGSLSACTVYPREIIKRLFALEAAAAVFAHNHPTGDPTPSADDDAITKTVACALNICGIAVLDHIIIGSEAYGDGFYSYQEHGLISEYVHIMDTMITTPK